MYYIRTIKQNIMIKIEINSNEVVQINNSKEYEMVYQNMRAFKNGASRDECLKIYAPKSFPIYLQGINSVTRGYSIGYTTILNGNETILTLNDFK